MEPSDEVEIDVDPNTDPFAPVVVKLCAPVQFGKDRITELVLKPNARAFKDLTLPMTQEGKVDYQPYPLAACGVRMAGHPNAVLDKLHPRDLNEVAQAVLGFLV